MGRTSFELSVPKLYGTFTSKEYADGRVDFVMGNGAETSFTPTGGGAYANKPGIHDKLTQNPGIYVQIGS